MNQQLMHQHELNAGLGDWAESLPEGQCRAEVPHKRNLSVMLATERNHLHAVLPEGRQRMQALTMKTCSPTLQVQT